MNGHQIHELLINHSRARLTATAGINPVDLPEALLVDNIPHYETLDELLDNKHVDLISLCSPRRCYQAEEAIRCLQAGKHVYAEKPCSMTEKELDKIIYTARREGKHFHEMAGTAFEQPYLEVRRLLKDGTVGDIVQVLAQKSYPYADWRSADEDSDGGIIMKIGIHAVRFVEHVAGISVKHIESAETTQGNPRDDDLCMAANMTMRLANGGLACAIANYLNPPAFGSWGNETLRIFGTKGFVEVVDGGKRTRLVLNEKDMGPLQQTEPSQDYFELYLLSLLEGRQMPLTLEEELHPTRVVIQAKANLRNF